MPKAVPRLILLTVCAAAGGIGFASAQAVPTATRRIVPSFFAGVTGVETGLNSGRNLSVTAGADLPFHPFRRFVPALEYRGMVAIDKGQVDSVKNSLGGIKLFKRAGVFAPYVDVLAGRGETTYPGGGYRVPGKIIYYTQSSSNVFSVGGGTDLFATGHLGVKVDLQLQRYGSPVTGSGSLYSETGTVGVVYVLKLGRGR